MQQQPRAPSRSLESFQLRQAEYRVEAFAINHHGAVLIQVSACRQIVVLIALVAFERSKFNPVQVPFHNFLSKVFVVALRKHHVYIRAI